MFHRIGFKTPMPVAGAKFNSLEDWSVEKHGAEVKATREVDEDGTWIVLTPRVGKRVRVPMHSVAYIQPSDSPAAEDLGESDEDAE